MDDSGLPGSTDESFREYLTVRPVQRFDPEHQPCRIHCRGAGLVLARPLDGDLLGDEERLQLLIYGGLLRVGAVSAEHEVRAFG